MGAHNRVMADSLVDTWRQIIVGDGKSWVLFAHGTCVIVFNSAEDLEAHALDVMREFGPVHPGTPSGDFNVVKLPEPFGWVVTCEHPDVLNYVSPDEVRSDTPEVTIGLLGRGRRHRDAQELRITHVEDTRGV